MALSRCGSAYQAPPLFLCWEPVVSVSGESGVPLSPSSTKLSSGFGEQRGHVPPPVAALGGNGTSPLDPVRCSVISASGQGGVPPCPRTTKLSRGMRGSCGTRPLRQSYITPHCPQCQPVSRKLLLCLSPLRALRVKATGFMQNCLRWVRSHSRRRSPVAVQRPTRRQLAPLWLSWRCGIGQALRAGCLVSGLRPVICMCPAHPCGPRRYAAFGPALGARPPPRGSLIPAQNTSRPVNEQCSRRFAPALLTHDATYLTLMCNRQQ